MSFCVQEVRKGLNIGISLCCFCVVNKNTPTKCDSKLGDHMPNRRLSADSGSRATRIPLHDVNMLLSLSLPEIVDIVRRLARLATKVGKKVINYATQIRVPLLTHFVLEWQWPLASCGGDLLDSKSPSTKAP